MAPVIPVYSKAEVEERFVQARGAGSEHVGSVPPTVPPNCQLKELTQNQCTFDGNAVYCLPFKRVFLRCWDEMASGVEGYGLTPGHAKVLGQGARGQRGENQTQGSLENQGNHAKRGGSQGRWRNIEITNEATNSYPLTSPAVEAFAQADEKMREQMHKYHYKD